MCWFNIKSQSGLRVIILLLALFFNVSVFGQVPANDNCSNATAITISDDGYGVGKFGTGKFDITNATVVPGETFAPAILVASLNSKSVWYKFTLANTRSIRVTLSQDDVEVTAGDVGFAVYKSDDCTINNGKLSTKLTPIATFGNTFHPCVEKGVYYIQVSAKAVAKGSVIIDVEVDYPSGSNFDNPESPHEFGNLSAGVRAIDFDTECLSIKSQSEKCTGLPDADLYNKTAWFTFTTAGYFDALSILSASPNGNFNYPDAIFGYNLYKGDAKADGVDKLTLIDACVNLKANSNGYYPTLKHYNCNELEVSTTYSIQFFVKSDFISPVRIAINTLGVVPTKGFEPLTSINPANDLGLINVTTPVQYINKSDMFACNAKSENSVCTSIFPEAGVIIGGTTYNLSQYYTFKLDEPHKITFNFNSTCGYNLVLRVFKKELDVACPVLVATDSVHFGSAYVTLDCLTKGEYLVQVLGVNFEEPFNRYYYGSLYNSGSPLCLMRQLGSTINAYYTAYKSFSINKFSLNKPYAIDSINKKVPLEYNTTYQSVSDVLGCDKTVMPDGQICTGSSAFNRAIYREFVVDKNGIVVIGNKAYPLTYKVYKGSAEELANAQNVNAAGEFITGLEPLTPCFDYYAYCYDDKLCVTPGVYTLVTAGNDGNIGQGDQPTFYFYKAETKFSSATKAENLGDIIAGFNGAPSGSITSAIDTFSCIDNYIPIPDYTACRYNGIEANKAIYREFYLSNDAIVNIYENGDCNYFSNFGVFTGRISVDGEAGLKVVPGWGCTRNVASSECAPLAAGWYTVISFGTGNTYDDLIKNISNFEIGGHVGKPTRITITVSVACPKPKFNRPDLASIDASTNKPHLIEWKARAQHTAAVPVTYQTYTLPTENFNCINDTPFINHPIKACANGNLKVAYWVIETTQESFVNISVPGMTVQLFEKDVRTHKNDFPDLKPVQECVPSNNGHEISICKLQPGVYTIVGFKGGQSGCSSTAPTIYIDKVGVSRFDFATNAYDFGVIPPDSAWYNGKVGDVHPDFPALAPSSDIFYCTTGAFATDPKEADCYMEINPTVYKDTINNANYTTDRVVGYPTIIKRNLWYSFVVEHSGWVTVKVNGLTEGKKDSPPFVVYKSDEDGHLSLVELKNQGKIDSTLTQGLTTVGTNYTGWYCTTNENLRFFRDPCNTKIERYYIVVNNRNGYGSHDFNHFRPNTQISVSILFDSVIYQPTKFDFYSKANNIGSNLTAGVYNGEVDNFTCATVNVTDPVQSFSTYAKKTLWYKFSVAKSGQVAIGMIKNKQWYYDNSQLQLFRETKAGDSTSVGLQYINTGTYYDSESRQYRSISCVAPGTYYIILTGYNSTDEDAFPNIRVIESVGDYCGSPVPINLKGIGSASGTATVNCHTIGTDYGEFGPNITCPEGGVTSQYKTSWFRIDVDSDEILDVTVYVDETTNASSSQIKYRLMTGNCGAMQEQSCVLDALTRNTYECLTRGSYYLQVLTPVIAGNAIVNGDIKLNISAVKHVGECSPMVTCLVNSNFLYQFDCTKDTAVRFINYSTFGDDITYEWNFGHNNAKSSEVSPSYFYPALDVEKTYKVKLTVTNKSCNRSEIREIDVTIPARPYVNIGNDVSFCEGPRSMTLDASSFEGATYVWNTGATTPTIDVQHNGMRQYTVRVDYNNCVARDTINIYMNTLQPRIASVALCEGDIVPLNSSRGQGEQIVWQNGYIGPNFSVSVPGVYYANILLYGCTVTDSFYVTIPSLSKPLGQNRSVCMSASKPYVLNAQMAGAQSYKWQDGSGQPTYNVTLPGKYWVEVRLANCIVRDTVIISQTTLPSVTLTTNSFCAGDSVLLNPKLPADFSNILWSNGATSPTLWVKAGGIYSVAASNNNGCAINSNQVTITEKPLPVLTISKVYKDICFADSAVLTATAGLSNYLWHNGSTARSVKVFGIGKYWVKARGANGCFNSDTLVITENYPVKHIAIDTLMCLYPLVDYVSPSGKRLRNSGNYRDTLRYQNGCDSVLFTIRLSRRPITTETKTVVVCEFENYILPGGKSVNTAGLYRDTLSYANTNCDSARFNITITIYRAVKRNIDTTICRGTSFELPYSKRLVNTEGEHRDTIKSVRNNCDSLILIYKVGFFVQKNVVIDTTICEIASYVSPGGKTFNTAGTYSDVLKYVATGCDSVFYTINIKVLPVKREPRPVSICEHASYRLPSGKVITRAGVYSDTLRYSNSTCDSVIYTYTLSIIYPDLKTINANICLNDSYRLPSGIRVNTDGIYLDTLRFVGNGCDSVRYTVNLTVWRPSYRDSSVTICIGNNFKLPLSGRQVNTAGIYNDTLKSVQFNCDSIITRYTITVLDKIRKTIDTTICEIDSYVSPGGKTFNTAGTYSDTLRYVVTGCDSVIYTVNLKVLPVKREPRPVSICEHASYRLPSGKVITQAGVYSDTLRYSNSACDSVIYTYTLSIIYPGLKTINANICLNDSYRLPSGIRVNTDGIYLDTLRFAGNGCDSVRYTVNLTVWRPSYRDSSVTICIGNNFKLPLSGRQVNTAGVYNDTLKSVQFNCDSIITSYRITVMPKLTETLNIDFCEGSAYKSPSGKILNQTGTYADTLRYVVSGCDSVIYAIHLREFKVTRQNINAEICYDQTYTFLSGRVVNTTGIYNDTLRYQVTQCDSLITVYNLLVKQPIQTTETVYKCTGQTHRLPDGRTVNAAGVYTSNVLQSNGCTGTHITTVNYYPPILVTLTASAPSVCYNQNVTITATVSGGNGNPYQYTWTPSGSNTNTMTLTQLKTSATVSLIVNDGCSTPGAAQSLRVEVTLLPDVSFTVRPSAGCMPLTVNMDLKTNATTSYLWNFGNGETSQSPNPVYTYNIPGTYNISVKAKDGFGCENEKLLVNAVTVHDVPIAGFTASPYPGIAFNRRVEFKNESQGAVRYQWQFGNPFATSRDVNPVHVFGDTGLYKVRLIAYNEHNCTDTAYLDYEISGTSAQVHIPNAFSPNGDGKNDVFRIFGLNIVTAKTRIFNRYGELIWEGDTFNGYWNGVHQKTQKDQISGAYVYYIQVDFKNGSSKSYKGTVSLVR
ncbi:PKD domain-containing protein [Polluticaenibacter yanchengensis]|uniref:PKD domain-containing protein n=1 Tax=Polluticaenibacter yanchengensis TaxID=3014562 RepID=A0ABT4UMZ0_9BACT|nr:PKD domain-containing protein [Chitinophagaceae bacterium LY-5]